MSHEPEQCLSYYQLSNKIIASEDNKEAEERGSVEIDFSLPENEFLVHSQ